MTRYLVLIGDGMSDRPLKELGEKTPLEAAKTPNLDFLAQNGICGWANNVPKNFPPASDVANLSIFGYDPQKYYTGRGPLEAASLGVKINKNKIAFRCNLVTVADGRMKDFTAGHIETEEAKGLIKLCNDKLGCPEVKFYPGLSYRHLLVVNKSLTNAKVKTTPPHDITGRRIKNYLPEGTGAEALRQLMNESEVIFHNQKTKATMIWPWGPGEPPQMPSFKKQYGQRGAIITAVHLLKGIGRILGLKVINVPGATGYLDTNYKGKAEAALKALQHNDIVFVHVEAPDEAGHEGNVRHKIQVIEDFDRLVVGTILKGIKESRNQGIKILALPDHPTPIALKTHSREAVPFVIYGDQGIKGPRDQRTRIAGYNERAMKKAKLSFKAGHKLLRYFLKTI
ncbi:cofactor-independent phosphoglycerate mutase [Candidatus Saganbacteria bacterium]|nr:cofactor-independent phosphoglycerate mutase [Candidatus Saganbacteria bacterium]